MTVKTSSAPQAKTHYSHQEILVIISALMTVLLLGALDQTIVSTALPKIAADLQSLDKLSWVATAYLLTSAIVTPIYGKISDLFGRKRIFQTAIIIFLVGSVLCGLSQNMFQLIIARGLQGIGGGGLMALVFSIVGDIIPPRQRGRYMGYFGAVWGVASVAGPLLGGFLTDYFNWRWIFFVNIPLGIFALITVAARLHLPIHKKEHKIDYLGAALLAGASLCMLLATVWGGNTYTWGSNQIIGLLVGGFILAVTFTIWEKRAKEPILPLRLFKNKVFTVSTLLSLLSGIAMFASILYIPVYQQIVRGYSPTKSGLMMLPLVVGIFISSVGSGKLITKYGKYKIFPVIGTPILALGLWLFSHLQVHTSEFTLGIWMLIIGLGLGSFMQVTVLAIQNAVSKDEIGVATSTATFFRSIGASFGGAIFGTIMVNRFAVHLQQLMPGASGIKVGGSMQQASNLSSLPPSVANNVQLAFVKSFRDMFLIAIIFAAAAFVVSLFLKEVPLRESHEPLPPEPAL